MKKEYIFDNFIAIKAPDEIENESEFDISYIKNEVFGINNKSAFNLQLRVDKSGQLLYNIVDLNAFRNLKLEDIADKYLHKCFSMILFSEQERV